ncbi:MAG: hypothetical protein LC687_06625, partial [Actinobacteria bacterium]|nr:hypothetical protein [Actinomycetota bacterium]
ESLRASYESFTASSINIISGISDGDGERDGDNARLVLDALPSRYDFPALITSLERILSNQNVDIGSISGTDDELSQRDLETDEPIQIPFGTSLTGNYTSVQEVVTALELSIRPFHISSISLAGEEGSMRMELQSHTYFQPEKRFEVQRQELAP